MSLPKLVNRRKSRQMCREASGANCRRVFRIANLPAAFAHQPIAKRHDGLRQTGVDRDAGNPHASVGARRGQRDDAGLSLDRGRVSVERSIGGLARRGIILHFCFKRRVHQLLDGPQCPKAGGQLNHRRAALRQRHRECRDTARHRRGETCRPTVWDLRRRTVFPASA